MTYAIAIIVFAAMPVFLFWGFQATMGYRDARTRLKIVGRDLSKLSKCMGYPMVLLAFLLDIACNLLHATLLFWEWPKESTVSRRVKRLASTGSPRRKRIAVKVRDDLLKDYDITGGHG